MSLTFGCTNNLDIVLNFLDQTDEFHKASPQMTDFLLDQGDMLIIHFIKGFKSVARMGSTPQCTLMANTLAAGSTING
jgi:hypothetical protein